jgi:NACHT domain/Caspase domain
MSPTEQPILSSETYALLMGIEEYDSPRPIPLPGCKTACERVREWLLRNGVPDENILMHLSPNSNPDARAEFAPIGASIRRIAEAAVDLVFVYWAGHGYAVGNQRNLLLGDSYGIGFAHNVDALIEQIGKREKVKRLVGIFDCCANEVDPDFQLGSPNVTQPTHKPELYVWFACGIGQIAAYRAGAQGGEFSDELFSELETRKLPAKFSDFEELDNALKSKFDKLKVRGQRPIRLHALTPQGDYQHDYRAKLTVLSTTAKKHPLLAWILRAASNYGSRYRAHVLRDREFSVEGLPTRGPFILDLANLYVEPMVRPTAPAQASPNPVASSAARKDRQPIWAYLRRYQHLALVGAPGMGKTTLLRNVAHKLAGGWLSRPAKQIPVYMPLQIIQNNVSGHDGNTPAPTLAEVIEHGLERVLPPPQGWFEQKLRRGQCLLLLDGLDEIGDPRAREGVLGWLKQEMARYPETRSVIASRPSERHLLQNVTVLGMGPWTGAQIDKFVRQWYLADEMQQAHDDREQARHRARAAAENFLAALDSSAALSELAVNPLLLTLLVTTSKYAPAHSDRRADLYRAIFDVFLETWPKARNRPLPVNAETCKPLLQTLGWVMMHDLRRRELNVDEIRASIEIPLRQARATVSARQFLKTVHDAGIFLEREPGIYEFSHFSFCEYLAAVHARAIASDEFLLGQVADSWWRQTLLFYAGLMPDASSLIERCLAAANPAVHVLTLALECLDEARFVKPAVRNQVESIRDRWIDDPDPERRRTAAHALLSLRIAGMARQGEIYVDRSPIAAFEYQLFLEDEAERGVSRQPDHLPLGRQLASRDPVLGIRALDGGAFCDWLTLRGAGDWKFRLPQRGETNGIGHWVIIDHGFQCLSPFGNAPLISAEQLRTRFHRDFARAMMSFERYAPVPRTRDPDREKALRAELKSLGFFYLDVVGDLASVVAGSFYNTFNSERQPRLGAAVRDALWHKFELETAWDRDLIEYATFQDPERFLASANVDLCPDLQLPSLVQDALDLGLLVDNMEFQKPWFASGGNTETEFKDYAHQCCRRMREALSRACAAIVERYPFFKEVPENERADFADMLRWHARLCAAIVTGLSLNRELLGDNALLPFGEYGRLYVALAVLEERIQGTAKPFESIMIVKEKATVRGGREERVNVRAC